MKKDMGEYHLTLTTIKHLAHIFTSKQLLWSPVYGPWAWEIAILANYKYVVNGKHEMICENAIEQIYSSSHKSDLPSFLLHSALNWAG